MIDGLIWVDAPHLYAGVVLELGVVIRFAPILKYMRGWTADDIKAYCRKKRWTFGEMPDA